MKRKNGPAVNLKAFLEKAAAKKRTQEATGPSQPSCIGPSQPSCIESQMQVVIYQGQLENESDSGASSPTTVPPDVENYDIGGGPNDESSSDEDNDGGVYDIEHDPGLRTPISQYDVNDQDSVRREYIALGPCQPKMKKGDFPQHECGAQAEYMIEALKLGEIESGQGLNQEMGLARPGDTRWGSHYKTVMHVMLLYPSIKKLLFKVGKECNEAEAIGAQTMLQVFQSFELVFLLHMMNEIFGYTSDFCNALQRREQDIVNAMDLLEFTKAELDVLREDCGWKEFLGKVTSFCVKHKVKVVDMDGKYKPIQRSRKFFRDAINYHRFHADMFLGVIDRQLQELNNRFDEVNTELLRCMASFSPAKSFSAFNVDNLVKLAKFYPSDFDVEEMNQLPFQLNRYISDVGKDENFTNLRSLTDLSMMLVKKKTRFLAMTLFTDFSNWC
nr:uncharacterized protein LOC4338173 [Oryza sativa Japonica Group]